MAFRNEMRAAGLGILAVAMGLGAGTAAAETLIWTDGAPNRGARAEVTEWLGSEIEARTGGELQLKFHWSGALMSFKDATKGIGSGVADMGLMVAAYNPGLHPIYAIADLPTEFSDPWVTNRAVYELTSTTPELVAEFERLNLKYISNITTTGIQLVCAGKAVTRVSDVNGLKIRGIGAYGKALSDAGAVNVSLPSHESYQALDTGLIDCTQMYAYAVESFKLRDVASSLTKLDWGALKGMAYVLNLDRFKGLEESQQKVLLDLGSEFVDAYSKAIIAGNARAYDLMEQQPGFEIVAFSKAEKAKLLQLGQKYVDAWIDEVNRSGLDGRALWNRYGELLAKYQEELTERGYPWDRKPASGTGTQ